VGAAQWDDLNGEAGDGGQDSLVNPIIVPVIKQFSTSYLVKQPKPVKAVKARTQVREGERDLALLLSSMIFVPSRFQVCNSIFYHSSQTYPVVHLTSVIL